MTKSMLIVFFDIHSVVDCEFIPKGHTTKSKFYCNDLRCMRCLREDIWWKWSELWTEANWMLHGDNAPYHQALITHTFVGCNSMVTLSHQPYSPDLAPCNFFLFSKLKLQLKGPHLDTMEELQYESQKVLSTFREQDSRTHSSSGHGAGSVVSQHMGTILKGMLSKL